MMCTLNKVIWRRTGLEMMSVCNELFQPLTGRAWANEPNGGPAEKKRYCLFMFFCEGGRMSA